MQYRRLIDARPGRAALRVAAAVLLAAAALLFHLPAEAQANERATSNLTLSSSNPGELVISWNAPSRSPTDYRVTWKKSTVRWTSFRKANTVEGGNAFPAGTSHTVTGLEEGTAYTVRVRARYFDGNGKLQKSGPWSASATKTTASSPEPTPVPTGQPADEGMSGSNPGRSTTPPAKPTGLLARASHDRVALVWDDPGDSAITGYQVFRGPDSTSLTVLVDDTGSATNTYTDSSVEVETTYVYAVKARNAHGISPRSDPYPPPNGREGCQ